MDFHVLLYIRHLVLTQDKDVLKTPWAMGWTVYFAKTLQPGEAYVFLTNKEIP